MTSINNNSSSSNNNPEDNNNNNPPVNIESLLGPTVARFDEATSPTKNPIQVCVAFNLIFSGLFASLTALWFLEQKHRQLLIWFVIGVVILWITINVLIVYIATSSNNNKKNNTNSEQEEKKKQ
jgi:xanthine/uracil permease